MNEKSLIKKISLSPQKRTQILFRHHKMHFLLENYQTFSPKDRHYAAILMFLLFVLQNHLIFFLFLCRGPALVTPRGVPLEP